MSAPTPEATFYIKVQTPTGAERAMPLRGRLFSVQIPAHEWPSESTIDLTGYQTESLGMGRSLVTVTLEQGIAKDSDRPTILINAPSHRGVTTPPQQHVDGDRALTYGGQTEYGYLRRYGVGNTLQIQASLVHSEYFELHPQVDRVAPQAVCLYKRLPYENPQPIRLLEMRDLWVDVQDISRVTDLLTGFPLETIELPTEQLAYTCPVRAYWTSEGGLTLIARRDETKQVILPPEFFLALGDEAIVPVFVNIAPEDSSTKHFVSGVLSTKVPPIAY